MPLGHVCIDTARHQSNQFRATISLQHDVINCSSPPGYHTGSQDPVSELDRTWLHHTSFRLTRIKTMRSCVRVMDTSASTGASCAAATLPKVQVLCCLEHHVPAVLMRNPQEGLVSRQGNFKLVPSGIPQTSHIHQMKSSSPTSPSR